ELTAGRNNSVTGSTIASNHLDGVILQQSAQSNTIGGSAAGAGNTITANRWGVQAVGAGFNTINGNAITANRADGVALLSGANSNTVGGTAAGAGNTIASNPGDGVVVASSNFNIIRGNSILGNGGLGIDLLSGGNMGLHAPVLTSAVAGSTSTTLQG